MCGPKTCVSKGKKKSSTKGRHGEDLEYIPKPREVVEGFDDTDETDSDLEMSQGRYQLRCLFYLVFSLEGGVGSHAMLYYLDSNEICTYLLLKFVFPILVVWVKEAIEEALPAGQKAALA